LPVIEQKEKGLQRKKKATTINDVSSNLLKNKTLNEKNHDWCITINRLYGHSLS